MLSTVIKLPFVIKFVFLSFFEWPLTTGFTVTKKTYTCCVKLFAHAYLRPSLSYHLLLRSLFCLFLSGRFIQVLL